MRIVIKIGTNLLTAKNGALDQKRISALAGEIALLKKAGHQVVLVTSGAIGSGMGELGWDARPANLREKQALAAVGQPVLMESYKKVFSKLKITIAQILLTRHDFDDRTRYLNARDTFLTLLDLGVVPIVNENDTIAVEEINFGDNDTLAALVAGKISADYLILLTDVDGLYRGIPGKSELFSVVEKITPEIEACASGVSSSGKGTGGMQTKIGAAKIATAAGVRMFIANGARKGVIGKIMRGEPAGTTFLPRQALDARKCWIAFGTKCRGGITVDRGAAEALKNKGKSLLSSGITAAAGIFKAGDAVSINDPAGKEIGRGITYYSSEDVEKIKGKKTSQLPKLLETAEYEEVIHRDNMVIL